LESPLGKTLAGPSRSIVFADQWVGQSAPPRDLRINNIGTANLTITSASITSGHTTDFTLNTSGMISPVPLETGSSPLVVIFHPSAVGLRQATLTLVTSSSAEPSISITLQGTGMTPTSAYNTWIASHGLTGDDALPAATPLGDGTSNLLKYAFNIPATLRAPVYLVPGTGNSGLPVASLSTSPGHALRLEYVRRKNSGLVYVPERSTTLTNFTAMTATPLVTSIDSLWERVVIEDPIVTGENAAFVRVRILLP
jgi:hypothetical protein